MFVVSMNILHFSCVFGSENGDIRRHCVVQWRRPFRHGTAAAELLDNRPQWNQEPHQGKRPLLRLEVSCIRHKNENWEGVSRMKTIVSGHDTGGISPDWFHREVLQLLAEFDCSGELCTRRAHSRVKIRRDQKFRSLWNGFLFPNFQENFKTQELPLARIKKIMKLDEDVKVPVALHVHVREKEMNWGPKNKQASKRKIETTYIPTGPECKSRQIKAADAVSWLIKIVLSSHLYTRGNKVVRVGSPFHSMQRSFCLQRLRA